MASVVEYAPGDYGLRFEDGKPFGHEVAAMVDTASATETAGRLRMTRLAVQAVRNSGHPHDRRVTSGIDEQYRYDSARSSSAVAYMTGGSVMRWVAESNDADLADFCRLNVRRHEAHQAALDSATASLQAFARMKVAEFVSVGFFPRQAGVYMEQALVDVNGLRALDSFEAAGYGKGAIDGIFVWDSGVVGLTNLFVDQEEFKVVSKDHQGVVLHEYLHAAGHMNDAGFLRGVHSRDPFGAEHFVEEPFVAHSVAAACNNQSLPAVMLPSKRNDRVLEQYEERRELVGWLMEHGPRSVDVEMLAQAFFTQRSTTSRIRQQLEANLNRSIKALLPSYKNLYKLGKYFARQGHNDAVLTGVMERAKARVGGRALREVTQSSSSSDCMPATAAA